MSTNKLIKIIIPQQVKVRKYEVDTKELVLLLRKHKLESKLTNKEIAEKLKQPLTLVEHWVRQDKSVSILDPSVWYKLKELLNIKTDNFDKSITEFEIRNGIYDKSNRVYDVNGLSPTLTCEDIENQRFIIYE